MTRRPCHVWVFCGRARGSVVRGVALRPAQTLVQRGAPVRVETARAPRLSGGPTGASRGTSHRLTRFASSGIPGPSGGSPSSSPSSSSSSSSGAAPVSAAVITSTPPDGAVGASVIEPVVVRAGNGTPDTVAVANPDGEPVTGAVSADGTSWTSAEPLGYGRRYRIPAAARDSAWLATSASSFTTVAPAGVIFPSFTPPPETGQVGVGQPLSNGFPLRGRIR